MTEHGPVVSSLCVREAEDPAWLAFVKSQPDATVFHHPAWSRVLAQAYGYRPLAITKSDARGRVVAGLPVVDHPRSGGRHLVGLPFTDYCPPLARSPRDLESLSRALLDWHRKTPASKIIVHGPLTAARGIHLVARAVRHVLPLGRPSAEVLQSIKGGQVPRAIRKAQREGLRARISRSPADLDTFYRLHLQTRRRLGVPVQPKRFLESIWDTIIARDLGFVVFADRGSEPVAAALFLTWNGTIIYKFGASDHRYWQLRPNNLVMWTAIEWACSGGYDRLDLGRSDLDNRGLRDFKSRWGSTEVPLVYSYVAAAPPSPAPKLAMRAMARVIQSSPPVMCRAIGEVLYGRVAGNLA